MAGSSESEEITALTKNLCRITDTVTVGRSLQWFANQLIEKGFITRQTAQGILGIDGITPAEKAGKLMDSVFAQINGSSDRKRDWFNDFVDIFSHDRAYTGLVEGLKKEVSPTPPTAVHAISAQSSASGGTSSSQVVSGSTEDSSGCESRAGLRAHDQPGYDSPSVASGASEEPAFPELYNARLACMTGHNEDLEAEEKDMKYACDELLRKYTAKVQTEFFNLISHSVKALERLGERDRQKFIRYIKRRFKIAIPPDMEIEEIMDTLCESFNWELENTEDLYSILQIHVDNDTVELRNHYYELVTGLYDVRSFLDRYKALIKCKYAHTLKVRYKVAPSIIDMVKKLWTQIRTRFTLPPLNVVLYDRQYSSLILTWRIDTDAETSELIKKLLSDHMKANIPFLKENKITHIIYDFKVFYSEDASKPQDRVMVFIQSEFEDKPLILFNICLQRKVLELKRSLIHQWGWLRHLRYQLVFQRKTLRDEGKLICYCIKDKSVIHLKVFHHKSNATHRVMVFIKSEFQDKPLSLYIHSQSKVVELKRSLLHWWSQLRHLRYQLIFRGRTLRDKKRITYYQIKDQSKIHLKLLWPKGSQELPACGQGVSYTDSAVREETTVGLTDIEAKEGHKLVCPLLDLPYTMRISAEPAHVTLKPALTVDSGETKDEQTQDGDTDFWQGRDDIDEEAQQLQDSDSTNSVSELKRIEKLHLFSARIPDTHTSWLHMKEQEYTEDDAREAGVLTSCLADEISLTRQSFSKKFVGEEVLPWQTQDGEDRLSQRRGHWHSLFKTKHHYNQEKEFDFDELLLKLSSAEITYPPILRQLHDLMKRMKTKKLPVKMLKKLMESSSRQSETLGNQMEYLELVNNIAKKMLSSYSEEEKVGDGRDTQDHLQNIMAEIRELDIITDLHNNMAELRELVFRHPDTIELRKLDSKHIKTVKLSDLDEQSGVDLKGLIFKATESDLYTLPM